MESVYLKVCTYTGNVDTHPCSEQDSSARMVQDRVLGHWDRHLYLW